MSDSLPEVIDRLKQIQTQLKELGEEAYFLLQDIPKKEFEDTLARVEAYRVTDFGYSANPCDVTFETVIDELVHNSGSLQEEI